jgi:hypothetical protein
MRTVLATLPDGLLVMSVVVNDQPLPRHFYRIVDQDGRTVSEYVALHDLAAYLQDLPAVDRSDPRYGTRTRAG